MTKPFSQACENNKEPILTILNDILKNKKNVLEIGSGTGQHAVYFANNLPFLKWNTSDLAINHEGINQWIDEFPTKNIERPILLNLKNDTYRYRDIDAIYTANTLHIISWSLVKNLFSLVENNLVQGGVFCVYGPFNYQGKFTSDSNANFNVWLKDRDINSGIRHFEDVIELAEQHNLTLVDDLEMPANNRLLTFIK